MLSRHGSRYPTTGSEVYDFGQKVAGQAGNFKATGPLSFLNDWKYSLGHEILVSKGEIVDLIDNCTRDILLRRYS